MDNYYFRDKKITTSLLSVFEDSIDVNKIYEDGFIKTRLKPQYRDRFLKRIKKLDYTPYKMDQITHGMAEEYDFNVKGIPHWVRPIIDEIYKQFQPMLEIFETLENPLKIEIGVARQTRGYYVPWHQDGSNQAVLSFCAMFNEEDFEDGEGGTFQFAHVTHNEFGEVIERDIVAEAPTTCSGQIIFFNPSTLNTQHRCTEITCDKKRFLLYGIIGEID